MSLNSFDGSAEAQSMTPMRGQINSVTDAFAVRVYPSNPYRDPIRIEVHVYDQNFYEVSAQVTPNGFMLASGTSRPVTVVVPFEQAKDRKVRVCTESIPFPGQQAQIRTQICGKFLGKRLL